MKKLNKSIILKKIILLAVLVTVGALLLAQNVEIEGKAKITVMDPATDSAQQVAREPDGTLTLMSSGSGTYMIGDFVQGGVVFWVSANGAHAKVVSIYDVVNVPWSNITASAIGPSAQSNINGAGNTVAIIMQSGHTSSAALHCANLEYGGYDDWYLPSRDELNQVYSNRDAINTTAVENGGEVLASTIYWSSTETNFQAALEQDFGTGDQMAIFKSNPYRVRAVRAF